MKKLDKSKAYYLGDLNSEQRASFYAVLLSEDESISIIRESEFKIEASDYVFYEDCEWYWYDEKDFKRFFNLEVVNALTLIEEEEWKPKQGDKVLANDKREWVEVIFVVEYNNFYYCEYPKNKNTLFRFQHIKPYEEEIKVGDWVFLNDEIGVCKISDKHDLEEVNNKFTLVKNPQLIELLNKEL